MYGPLSRKEPPGDLVIRARQAYDNVAADPDRFRAAAEAVVAEARQVRYPEALAPALRALAWAERARLNHRAAIGLLGEAIRVARRHHLDGTLAELLVSHAAVSQELGRMAAARRDLRAATLLADSALTSELDFQRAVLLQNAGRLADAATIYHRLLADPDASAPRKVKAANNLALIESDQGRYGPALRRLDQALPLAAEVGPALAAGVIQSRAWVTVQSGRFAEGLRLFQDAEQLYRDAGLPLGEHYIEYADVLMELRLLPEAMTAARRAAAEFSSAGVPLMAAEAQLRVAQLALLSGDHEEAVAASATAASTFRRQARPGWRARTLLVTAEARLRSGTATIADLSEARSAAERLRVLGTLSAAVQGFLVTGRLAAFLGRPGQAVTALTRAGSLARGMPVLVRLRGRVSAALAADLRSRGQEALEHCRRGLTDLARHRGSLPSVELRALASGHGAELGRIGLAAVIRDGSPARVLNWMERSRAAALLAVEPPVFDQIRADLTALRAVGAAYAGAAHARSEPAGAAEAAAGQAAIESAVIESRIRQATWRAGSAAGSPDAPVTVGALRDVLAGRVLIAYAQLGEELVAVTIGPRASKITALGPLGPVREQLRALLFALRRLAQPRPEADVAAARASADLRIRRLAELLLAPLQVPAHGELVIVPFPDLQGVPWSALHGGPVSLAPSATFWARSAVAAAEWRSSARAAAADVGGGTRDGVVLVAGPGLPGAIAEVESLAGIHPPATRLMPPASTADAVADALAGAGLAHLACHGTLRADNPMFSSLLLSDGPLTVQEIYARGLAPHRLVLAACESGTLIGYEGDEVLGFVSALLARGTAGILASTVAVPDVETAGLMIEVHRRLAHGFTLARALHEARAAQDTSDPASFVSWCTFNAHGAALTGVPTRPKQEDLKKRVSQPGGGTLNRCLAGPRGPGLANTGGRPARRRRGIAAGRVPTVMRVTTGPSSRGAGTRQARRTRTAGAATTR
jgi:tetratricopeptide (TPR) repeat protein